MTQCLEKTLWAAADKLRHNRNAADKTMSSWESKKHLINSMTFKK
jgi:hypothetical protein